MKFTETPLAGAYVIAIEPHSDERGMFARTFCEREFEAKGLCGKFVQTNATLSLKRGTLRGMHYQAEPSPEIKVVRCVRGSFYDVIVDLRPQSKTYLKWFGIELSQDNRLSLYVPAGFAHGLQTLEDNTEAHYLMSEFFTPELARGVRYNDPKLGIIWPLELSEISDRDRELPLI